MNILNKKQYLKLYEKLNHIKENDIIFIHHFITGDLIEVIVKETKYNELLVSIPENSDYYGQPPFYIKKHEVVGIK